MLKSKKTHNKIRNLQQNLTNKRALSVFSKIGAQGSMKWDKFYFNQIKVGFLEKKLVSWTHLTSYFTEVCSWLSIH